MQPKLILTAIKRQICCNSCIAIWQVKMKAFVIAFILVVALNQVFGKSTSSDRNDCFQHNRIFVEDSLPGTFCTIQQCQQECVQNLACRVSS